MLPERKAKNTSKLYPNSTRYKKFLPSPCWWPALAWCEHPFGAGGWDATPSIKWIARWWRNLELASSFRPCPLAHWDPLEISWERRACVLSTHRSPLTPTCTSPLCFLLWMWELEGLFMLVRPIPTRIGHGNSVGGLFYATNERLWISFTLWIGTEVGELWQSRACQFKWHGCLWIAMMTSDSVKERSHLSAPTCSQ